MSDIWYCQVMKFKTRTDTIRERNHNVGVQKRLSSACGQWRGACGRAVYIGSDKYTAVLENIKFAMNLALMLGRESG